MRRSAWEEQMVVLGEANEHVHHLELDLDRLAVSGQSVEARFDQPIAKVERLSGQCKRTLAVGHSDDSLGRNGTGFKFKTVYQE